MSRTEDRPNKEITPEQAASRLQALLQQGKTAHQTIDKVIKFLQASGEAGEAAVLVALSREYVDKDTAHALTEALFTVEREAEDLLREYWPGLGLEAKKTVLARELSADFLPCFRDAAAAADPGLRLMGLIRLLDLDRTDAGEQLLDLMVSPLLVSKDRYLARFYTIAAYRRYGASAFPSFWVPDSGRYERLRRTLILFEGQMRTKMTPLSTEDHLAAIAAHLADPDPALRLRAVKNAVPEQLGVEEWRRLFEDPSPEVRKAAVERVPMSEGMADILLGLLDNDTNEEIKVIIGHRSDLPMEQLMPHLAALVSSPALGNDSREVLAGRLLDLLSEMQDEGHPVPDHEPVCESLLASSDFRLRRAAYGIRQALGQEARMEPYDAFLSTLVNLAPEDTTVVEKLAEEIAAYGPEILRSLMEAGTFIDEDSPAMEAIDRALQRLGVDEVLPCLIELSRDDDEEVAANAASTLSIFAPSDEVWRSLMELWERAANPLVQWGLMNAAGFWPIWKAGALYLRVIEGNYLLRRREDAIDLAIRKGVPGLGRVALRLLVSGQAPDLTDKLHEALAAHLREAEDPEEEVEQLNPGNDEAAREILRIALEEARREIEEEED